MRSRLQTTAWLALVAVFFAIPLARGLGDFQLRGDEAIYAYAVDRILETGDWLAPRAIQWDGPFLEKPPLKMWLVAGAMYAGVLPHDEFGMRAWDALFGIASFLYVFLLGRRLMGPVSGAAALLVLFTMPQLLTVHGLRSHNMEAALVLCHCGGLYHFARWMDGTGRRPARHATGVALYFVLGFMTKFVAALFLPLVCAAVLLGARERHLLARWREWRAGAALAAGLIVPWFAYAAIRFGDGFWQEIVGIHVVTRFTGSLDPAHLAPWHYYVTYTWAELGRSGSRWIVLAGLVELKRQAWAGRPEARLLLWWWWLPIGLMSLGTSKLSHYVYPFLPPLALAAGVMTAAVARTAGEWLRAAVRTASWPGRSGRAAAGLGMIAALLFLLPFRLYPIRAAELRRESAPLRALRDCALTVRAARPELPSRVYVAGSPFLNHEYAYYLRYVGGISPLAEADPGAALKALTTPDEEALVLASPSALAAFESELRGIEGSPGDPDRLPQPRRVVWTEPNVAALLPGAYAGCADAAVEAGARGSLDTLPTG
ncbi:MAG: hypothetical protein FJW23_11740 [Acidimicrobiia bacterium]|nr:hypothetical protein [Acidimicrobiia bacterium]